MRNVSKTILVAFIAICARAHSDELCPPDEIGIYMADEPGYERVDVIWNGNKYRKFVKGRARDPKNEEEISKWILKLEEKECNPSRS